MSFIACLHICILLIVSTFFQIRVILIRQCCIRMGKRGGHKVKGFKGEWLGMSVAGLKVIAF